MPDISPAEQWRLSQLNLQIDQLETRFTELEADRLRLRKQLAQARRRLRYLRAARSTRAPSESFELWRIGLLTIGPIAAGLFLLLASSLFIPSSVSGLLIFFLGAVLGFGVLALLTFYPADNRLPAELEDAAGNASRLQTRLEETEAELVGVQTEREALIEERRELMASGQVQRAALLQRDWKAMGEIEWEDFVVEACRTLGATVERRSATGKLPPVLLIQFGDRTTAAITRGNGKVVDSSAVNNALQAREQHHTDGAAVIINRRFTGAAQDLGRHRGCSLVGVEEFPDFVLGKREL